MNLGKKHGPAEQMSTDNMPSDEMNFVRHINFFLTLSLAIRITLDSIS
jgi:hypothetical protein